MVPFKFYIFRLGRLKMQDKKVQVAVTPNGYADSVFNWNDQEYFVMPEEKMMTMLEFLDRLESPRLIIYLPTTPR